MHTNLQIVNLRQRPVLFLFFLSFYFDLKHARDPSDLSRYYACAWSKLSGQEDLPFQQRTTGTENFLYLLQHCRHHDRSRQAAWLDEESARNNLYSSLVALEHINNICEGYWVVVVVSWCFTPSQPVQLFQGDGYWSLCLTCKRRWRGRLPASLPLTLTTTRLIG